MSGEGSRLATPREWSLILRRWMGRATKREGGGQVKFFPCKKGGHKKF